jgi:alpha-1,6-mannosyltransferase
VLDVTEYFGHASGGVRTYLLAKAEWIASQGDLTQALVIPGDRDAVVPYHGTQVYRLRGPAIPFHASYRVLLATRSLRRIIAHERPDLIEVGSSYFAPWLVAHARRRVPVAWFYHANLPRLVTPDLLEAPAWRRVAARAVGTYVGRIGRMVDATLAASDFAARDLASWGVERVERVTLGVDIAHFTPVRRAAAAATREALGIGSQPLVGYCGRLAPEKRVMDLLRAWPAIAKATGATLLLMGHGPEHERLVAAADPRTVRILPHERDRHRLADVLAALDCYVSPAPFETFGLSVAEALASGTPVVSVNHGAAAELVHASGGGALYEPGDLEGLARAVVRIVEGPRDRLGVRGRAHMVVHHAWPVAMRRLFAAYATLLGR